MKFDLKVIVDVIGEQNIDVKCQQIQRILIAIQHVNVDVEVPRYLSLYVLCGHNTGQGHLWSPGMKDKTEEKKSGLRAEMHVLRSDFLEEHKK